MFKKSIETEYGEDADYWEVTEIRINAQNKSAEVRLGLFKTKGKFQSGKNPFTIKSYIFSGVDFPFSDATVNSMLREIKAKIKATDTFFATAPEE
jgi:hypothetical protein